MMRRRSFFASLFAIWISLSGSGWTQSLCKSPTSAVTDSTFSWPSYSIGLNACVNKGETIECSMVLTLDDGGDTDLNYRDNAWFPTSKLIDNFEIEHPQVRGYFENGRCGSQESVNLAKGDKVWIVQEFGGAKDDITQARIVFPNIRSYILSGPVRSGGLPPPASQ